VGRCAEGRVCTRDTVDTTRLFCAPASCPTGCACGQVCSFGTCVALCAPGTRICGCNNCCAGSQVCSGGVCVGPPP
jgi:hypothetical protein